MKRVQHEKKATRKNINCCSEIWKKCTRIVHYSAQTDDRHTLVLTTVSKRSDDVDRFTSCIRLFIFIRINCVRFSPEILLTFFVTGFD